MYQASFSYALVVRNYVVSLGINKSDVPALQNGWPIPGDVRIALSAIIASSANYILGEHSPYTLTSILEKRNRENRRLTDTQSAVIEKFGIFTRLVQDKFFNRLPCILICGKGYPSVATRAMTWLLASRLR